MGGNTSGQAFRNLKRHTFASGESSLDMILSNRLKNLL